MNKNLNDGHFTEAFERAHLLGQIIELIGTHPVFWLNKELQDTLNKTNELAGNLYQQIGVAYDAWCLENKENKAMQSDE